MPFNLSKRYVTDPANFSAKAKEILQTMSTGVAAVKLGEMSIGNGMGYVLYFHRKCGLVAVLSSGDGEFGYQGMRDFNISLNKMLLFVDNVGSTDPDAIPQIELIRRHMFGTFEGTPDELSQATTNGPASIARFFVAADISQVPRFDFDFFSKILELVQEDSKASPLDVRSPQSRERDQA